MKNDRNSFFIKWGERFFKVRSFTAVPLFLILVFCNWKEIENDKMIVLLGFPLLILGESLRLWALRYIGKYSRTRTSRAWFLITEGPYAFTRNPIYIGNLFIFLGFTIISELIWLIPIFIILFYLHYYCIIRWEEQNLREHFLEHAEHYFQMVPRWIPQWQLLVNPFKLHSTPNYSWIYVIQRERDTLLFITIMSILLILKELLGSGIMPI